MIGYILSGVLFIVVIILMAVCKEKNELIKDLKADNGNLKAVYQKSLNKEYKEIIEQKDKFEKDNQKLAKENKALKEDKTKKEALLSKIKQENEMLKDNNTKLNAGLLKEKDDIQAKLSDVNEKNEKIIQDLQEQLNYTKQNYDTIKDKYDDIIKTNEKLVNDGIEVSKQLQKEKEKISKYQEYVKELRSDINEFEEAYVAIGGKLSDIYEDYED